MALLDYSRTLGDILAARKNKISDVKEKDIDVLKNELVPEHRILSDEEKQKLLEKYNITAKQLPRILATDPVVKQIDSKIGDVLEIKRKSKTAGMSLYYRFVVA